MGERIHRGDFGLPMPPTESNFKPVSKAGN